MGSLGDKLRSTRLVGLDSAIFIYGSSRTHLPESPLLYVSTKKAACVPEKMAKGHRIHLMRLHPSLTRLPAAAGPRRGRPARRPSR